MIYTVQKFLPPPCFNGNVCSCSYAIIPMLLSTCFYCHMHEILTPSEGKFIFYKWWPMGNGDDGCCGVKNVSLSHLHKKLLTKDNQKKIAHCPIFIKKFFWQKTTRNKFLTKENHKKIASLSHLHFVPMLYVHSPMLPFPCSCLHSSVVTCLKLALTVSGIYFSQMITHGQW